MPERPIILFGKPDTAEKSKRGGGAPLIQYPLHSRQKERIAPKMTALQNAVAMLKLSQTGIEAEKTLVFDVAGSIDAFYTSVKNLGCDAEWIFDMSENFDVYDDFFVLKEDKNTKKRTRNEKKKVIGGKIYCILSNTRAMEEILSLWNRYSKDPNTDFPDGKNGLKHVFACLIDIRLWGYKERIEETGILEAWNDDLRDSSTVNLYCEIELFFRMSTTLQQKREDDLVEKIVALGGTVISKSTIKEICYHAVLAILPRNAVEKIIKNDQNISLLSAEQIMFFRPVGQSVYIPDGDNAGERVSVPTAEGLKEEPVIALFDGLPQENHPFLSNRLLVDDPDDYASYYTVQARKHGTSMASLIALGDVANSVVHQATHKIYVRPIMKPIPTWRGTDEEIPGNILLVDKIHEAIRRLFEAEAGAVAKNVKVINLSIGIMCRQFDRTMSPLARLLDWLSCKYHILFVVSSGNHNGNIDTRVAFEEFAALNMEERDAKIIEFVHNNAHKHRLLSPSESMNSLTVGATFDDNTAFTENARFLLPCSNGMLSPISSVGKGLNNSVKPDIVYPGGRNVITESPASLTSFQWRKASQREPGIISAAPFAPGENTKITFSFGTSNSAAMISHEASRCYDTLVEVFADINRELPDEHMALLIKAMLVHGAEWGTLKDAIIQKLELTNRNKYSDVIHRFIGYGKPNINRAIECTMNRITLIGYEKLNDSDAHLYVLPLPFNFNNERILRRLTVTLTYFTPIVPSRQSYRATQLWFNLENAKRHLFDRRVDVNDKAVIRGSVQHEVFENDEIVTRNEGDSIQIKVNCRSVDDNRLSFAIPYALIVSFEIKSDIDIDVYTTIAEKVRPCITV